MTISYEEFKEYYETNADLDNLEYYETFPDVNKSTIRSWKSRAAKQLNEPIPEVDETERQEAEGYEELQKEYIKLLMKETNSKETEFKGVDDKSVLVILKNRKAAQELQSKSNKRPTNTGVLPSPLPIGTSNKRFGIDDYIEFDKVKDEIRMEIPMDVLLDPERNKKLGLLQ